MFTAPGRCPKSYSSSARAYRVTATPHMYVVDPHRTLIYAGAIDSKPGTNPKDIETATNFVSQRSTRQCLGRL